MTDEESSDRTKDPFEQFESEVAGREGDPFENLSGEGAPHSDGTERGKSTSATDSAEPGGTGGGADPEQSRDAAREASRESAQGEPREDVQGETLSEGSAEWVDDFGVDDGLTDPLGDVGDREGDPFEEGNSLFEERDTEGIDPDSVWQDLASTDSSGGTGEEFQRTFADVSKHSYCEQCEHFSSPPEITCTHEGTDIVEFLDMETVRVVDCPIVAERRELERDE